MTLKQAAQLTNHLRMSNVQEQRKLDAYRDMADRQINDILKTIMTLKVVDSKVLDTLESKEIEQQDEEQDDHIVHASTEYVSINENDPCEDSAFVRPDSNYLFKETYNKFLKDALVEKDEK